MVQPRPRNLLALAVLSYLTERPMHPYELGRLLRERQDDRSIKFNASSLYLVVQQLERDRLITAVTTDRDGTRPERTIYELTEHGRGELADWLRRLVGEPTHEYTDFVAGLSFLGALDPDEAVGLLGHRLTRLTEIADEIREMLGTAHASGVPALFLIEEDFRLAMCTAEHDFVTELLARITDPTLGWIEIWRALHEQFRARRTQGGATTTTPA